VNIRFYRCHFTVAVDCTCSELYDALVVCRFRNGKETRKVSKLFALRGKFPPLPQPFAVPLKGAINARMMADLSAVSTTDFVIPKWSVTACSQSGCFCISIYIEI
jgi:hypothetical protein